MLQAINLFGVEITFDTGDMVQCLRKLCNLRTLNFELESHQPRTMKRFSPMEVQEILGLQGLQTLWIIKEEQYDVGFDFLITDGVVTRLQLQEQNNNSLKNLLTLKLRLVTDPAIRTVLQSAPLLQDVSLERVRMPRVNLASDFLHPLTKCPKLLSLHMSIDGVVEAEDVDLLALGHACPLLEQLGLVFRDPGR